MKKIIVILAVIVLAAAGWLGWRLYPSEEAQSGLKLYGNVDIRQVSLSFEQGGNDSFYFSEELSSMNDYSQTVKVNDRATMVNLMVGLYGYTLCSGIVCEELNGGDYRVIPLSDDSPINGVMKVGYIVKKNQILSSVGKLYIEKIQEFLHAAQDGLSN